MERADANESFFLAGSEEVFVLLSAQGRCLRIAIGGAMQSPIDFDRWLGLQIQDCFTIKSRGKFTRALERSRSSASSAPQHFEATVPLDQGGARGCRLFEATIVSGGDDRQILALRDVTDRKEASKLEARLAHDEMLEALGVLTGSIAHDFNNLLGSITSFAELASRTSFDDRVNDYVESILSAVRRGRDLTRGLSSFAKGGELTPHPIELAPLLHEIAPALTALRPEGEITVATPAEKARVLGDASQLHRALLNVGKNAIDAVREDAGAKVALILDARHVTEPDATFALPAGSYALLRIEDQGHGMDEATMGRLFDPFFTSKAPGEGTGLGLAVVHGIARAHGGDVRVTSSPGHGTSVVIALPLLDMAGDPALATEIDLPSRQPPTPAPPQRTRLLVVDDDSNVGRLLALLLETLGHEVVLERSSVAALQLVRAAVPPFDLVLTDLSMPELDGLSLARELAALERSCPVVVMSGQETRPSREAFRSGGIAALLTKPFMLSELEETLAPLLGSRVRPTH